MSVKLREKQLKNGQISFYLDIYHNKKRWYEFLEIHIQKNKPCPDDKDKKGWHRKSGLKESMNSLLKIMD